MIKMNHVCWISCVLIRSNFICSFFCDDLWMKVIIMSVSGNMTGGLKSKTIYLPTMQMKWVSSCMNTAVAKFVILPLDWQTFGMEWIIAFKRIKREMEEGWFVNCFDTNPVKLKWCVMERWFYRGIFWRKPVVQLDNRIWNPIMQSMSRYCTVHWRHNRFLFVCHFKFVSESIGFPFGFLNEQPDSYRRIPLKADIQVFKNMCRMSITVIIIVVIMLMIFAGLFDESWCSNEGGAFSSCSCA